MSFSKYIKLLLLLCLFLSMSGSNQHMVSEDVRLEQVLKAFAQDYRELGLTGRSLSYADNLQRIQEKVGLEKQRSLFEQAALTAQSIQEAELSPKQRLYFKQWLYEIALNQQRIALELKYVAARAKVTHDGLLQQHLGKEWYRYFLKEFLSLDISPEELKAFGLQEVQKVQREIARVQSQMGYAQNSSGFYTSLQQPSYFLTNEEAIIQAYDKKYKIILQHLPKLFSVTDVPALYFSKVTNADENTPPGIYSSNARTFYFNFYGQRHNTRSMDFLLIHEGVPGHHYQSSINAEVRSQNPLGELFWYFAYAEGWAAYCEELSHELGLYTMPQDYLGKLEWDLVRSARVVMDVGLNYEGWTKEHALAFWKQHIPNQDDIAMREIDRMLRWPVQVHTYKVGADFILKQRRQAEQEKGFEVRQFHEQFLENGPLPLGVINNN